MFLRNNKTRKYQTPCAAVTDMALESNFCATVRFLIDVDELENMNAPGDPLKGKAGSDAENEVFYFES